MFCDKCGTQLADTASFCSKCGNTIKKKENTIPKAETPSQAAVPKVKMPVQDTSGKKKNLTGIFVLLAVAVILIIAAVIVVSKPKIYGTWSDSSRMITFAFHKDGSLQVSGKNNILGADLFQYTLEKDTIHLQADAFTGSIAFDMSYELSKDTLSVQINGYNIILYRMKDSDASDFDTVDNASGGNEENSNLVTNIVEDTFEDVMDVFQISFLYGTWSDNSGILTITFKENNTVRIAGLEDTLGVELFTFSEYDNDTLQLKADTDNKLLGMIKLNMDYEISGDTLTVSIAGQRFQLKKQN